MKKLFLALTLVLGLNASAQSDWILQENNGMKMGICLSTETTRPAYESYSGLVIGEVPNMEWVMLALNTQEYLYEGAKVQLGFVKNGQPYSVYDVSVILKNDDTYVLCKDLRTAPWRGDFLSCNEVLVMTSSHSYLFTLRGSTRAYNYVD